MCPMKAILIAAFSLAAIGCQQEASKPAKDVPPPAGEKPAPSSDSADAASYVGMTLEAGSARADKAEIRWRVVEEDGKGHPVTMDFRPDRLNFSVAAGKIIRVTKG